MSAGAPPPDDAPTLYQGDAPTVDAPPPDATRVVPPDEPPPAVPPRRRRPPWPPDRGLWPWLALLLVLVVAGVIAAILLSGGNGKKSTSSGPGTGTIFNSKPGTVLVPSVVGMRQADATARLDHLGLTVQTREQQSRRAQGVVLSQTPKPGTRLARGRLVGLVVSSGPPQAGVPDVTGLTAADAAAKLRDAGLRSTTKQVFSTKPAGTVVAQSPGAGATLTKGAAVALSVSKGPAKAAVPDVTGLKRVAAEQRIRAAGFVPRPFGVPSTSPADTVVSQSPVGGSQAGKGSTVRLNIAKGSSTSGGGGGTQPSQVRVPNVVGKQQAAAQKALANAGLRSRVTYVASPKPQGTVLSQSPTAGTTVKRSSRVALKVSTGPSTPQETAVPDVTGEDEGTATSDLESAGFQVQVVEQQTADASQDGIVLDQDPAGGSQAPAGATVTIVVGRSSG